MLLLFFLLFLCFHLPFGPLIQKLDLLMLVPLIFLVFLFSFLFVFHYLGDFFSLRMLLFTFSFLLLYFWISKKIFFQYLTLAYSYSCMQWCSIFSSLYLSKDLNVNDRLFLLSFLFVHGLFSTSSSFKFVVFGFWLWLFSSICWSLPIINSREKGPLKRWLEALCTWVELVDCRLHCRAKFFSQSLMSVSLSLFFILLFFLFVIIWVFREDILVSCLEGLYLYLAAWNVLGARVVNSWIFAGLAVKINMSLLSHCWLRIQILWSAQLLFFHLLSKS